MNRTHRTLVTVPHGRHAGPAGPRPGAGRVDGQEGATSPRIQQLGKTFGMTTNRGRYRSGRIERGFRPHGIGLAKALNIMPD